MIPYPHGPMPLSLSLLPYLEPLLRLHENRGQQPDNLCGPYWVSLLLQAYGGVSVSAVETAIAAATALPSQGNPADWLPSGAHSRSDDGYERIATLPDLAACGTAISGLMRATRQLSQEHACLIPLQIDDWTLGLSQVLDLCNTHLDWQIVPILNVHTGYLWGSQPTPLQLFSYLQMGQLAPLPADWKVGHFALLVGCLQPEKNSLYAVLDTYPQFGWKGLHLQPSTTLAQALERPHHDTQGGIALFAATAVRSQIISRVEQAGLRIATWDNGSPDRGG